MGVSLYEQETTISYSRQDKGAMVWTSDSTVMTKLDNLCKRSPKYYRCTDVAHSVMNGEIISKTYEIADKSMLSFRSNKITRELTQEQREELRRRLAGMRGNRNSSGEEDV